MLKHQSDSIELTQCWLENTEINVDWRPFQLILIVDFAKYFLKISSLTFKGRTKLNTRELLRNVFLASFLQLFINHLANTGRASYTRRHYTGGVRSDSGRTPKSMTDLETVWQKTVISRVYSVEEEQLCKCLGISVHIASWTLGQCTMLHGSHFQGVI